MRGEEKNEGGEEKEGMRGSRQRVRKLKRSGPGEAGWHLGLYPRSACCS